jgi:subtilisin family serine protease
MVTFRDIDFYVFYTGNPDHTDIRGDYYAISVRYSNCEIENSRFYCHNTGCGMGIESIFSKVIMREYITHGFKHMAVTRHTSWLYAFNGSGLAETTFVNYGCILSINGTRPNKIISTHATFDNPIVTATVISADAEPPTGITAPGEYIYYASFSGSWADDTVMLPSASNIRQGEDSDGKIYTGVFGFNLAQMRSDLAGETIKNVYLRLTRFSDLQSVRDIHLWGCDRTDISGQAPEKNSTYDYGFVSKFNGGDSTVTFGLNASIIECLISEDSVTPNSLMLFDDWFSPMTILGYDQLDTLRPMLRVCV